MTEYLLSISSETESLRHYWKSYIKRYREISDDMYYLDALIQKQSNMGKAKKLGGKDLLLIAQIKSGGLEREKGMSTLFKKFQNLVHRGINRYKLTEVESQEVYMDSLLALASAIDSERFQGDSKISTYLYRIFENKAKNKLRDRMRQELPHDWIEDIPSLPDRARNMLEEMLREEEQNWVERFLDEMGSRCRDILIMQEFEGYSQQEIADKLGLKNPRAVSTSRYRCLEKLKKILRTPRDIKSNKL